MEEKVRCLIIDDEPPARELLLHYLSKIEDIEIAGVCANGFEALKEIRTLHPTLLFLDIQMPKINGFELLELLDEDKPEVIFCTAFDAYAIKAFELHAVDYLLKPYTEQRLKEAVDRAVLRIRNSVPVSPAVYQQVAANAQPAEDTLTRIIAKTGTNITVIPAHTIHYLEAQDDYVLIVSDFGKHLKEKTLKYYETHLAADTFIRIHRSFIVNIKHIKSISLYGKESYRVKLLSGDEIKASATGYKQIRNLL